ncbi:unnamed protein product [Toxocara canis]|uniref:Secreted protein n=1 Tax=Toxocara canis TaxID=6265 RepID=A0A183UUX8_TOXCA|nr:unnamed protein product [Toxocara canis]
MAPIVSSCRKQLALPVFFGCKCCAEMAGVGRLAADWKAPGTSYLRCRLVDITGLYYERRIAVGFEFDVKGT